MTAAAGRLHFTLEATAGNSSARAARFTTRHHEVLTPTFMPVGTHAAVRSQRREDLLECGAQVLLANTYHLLLRPGLEIFEKFGGIHGFMNWPRAVLTDSGGYQIFSLPGSRTLCEEHAEFTSYTDGTLIRLSPERSIEAQKVIGADIMMALDQCVPATVDYAAARSAMQLTHRWAQRSLAARGDSPQALFGIVQGASYADLRGESARIIAQMPFDGYAIGGLAVGESSAQREDCTATVTELLPPNSPRYLMGVGHHARFARSRASGRRHVRLHSADLARQAGRGFHQPGQARSAARRVSRHGGPDRSRLPVLHLQDLLDRLPVSFAARA